LIIVAWIIEASNALFTNSTSAWVILVYYVGLTFIIGSIIWFILYVSPNLIQSFRTSSNQTQPVQTQEPTENNTESPQTQYVAVKRSEASAPVQVEMVPVRKDVPLGQDETDSERLRREFRDRGF
jgi:hypothetical protein